MRKLIHEKNLVIALFVMVIVTFSFAQRDSKKLGKFYNSGHPTAPALSLKSDIRAEKPTAAVSIPVK